jgi:hypothetical protein
MTHACLALTDLERIAFASKIALRKQNYELGRSVQTFWQFLIGHRTQHKYWAK